MKYILIEFLLFSVFLIDFNLPAFPVFSWLKYLLLAVCFLGFVIIFAGILNLNQNIHSVFNSDFGRFLKRYSIYKYVRHPIYSGIFVTMISYSIHEGSGLKIVATVILAIVFYFKSEREEVEIMQLDELYSEYKEITGRFFPRIKRK